MPGSRKLGRPTDHRKSMLRGMVTFLLENGKIETTVTRAKEVRAMTEKMITSARTILSIQKTGSSYVTKEDVVKKLLMKLLLSMQTETAVIAVLSKQALVVVTQQRCASSSLLTDNT